MELSSPGSRGHLAEKLRPHVVGLALSQQYVSPTFPQTSQRPAPMASQAQPAACSVPAPGKQYGAGLEYTQHDRR